MLMPSFFRENLFDDWFDFPDFRDLDRTERKLYGRHADRLMKTDVHEHDDHYEVDIDLPGFKKDEITIELNNGYLTVRYPLFSSSVISSLANPGRSISTS